LQKINSNHLPLLAGIILAYFIFQPGIFAYSEDPEFSPVILSIDSPLKQFKTGIPINDIQCKDDLVKIIKSNNSSPACVKPGTVEKLLLRGWGEPIDDSQTTKTVTLEDDGKTIVLKAGEEFLLKLGENFEWDIQIDDQSVVSRVPYIMVVRGAQGVYESHQEGHAVLTGVGNPLCLYSDPPCKIHSILFTLEIQVNP